MEKVEKSNTQHLNCLFFHLKLPPASTNIMSFALTLGDSITDIMWTAQEVSVSMVSLNPPPLHHSSADHR